MNMRVQGDSGSGYVPTQEGTTATTTIPPGFQTGPTDTQQAYDRSNDWRSPNHTDPGVPILPPPANTVDPSHPFSSANTLNFLLNTDSTNLSRTTTFNRPGATSNSQAPVATSNSQTYVAGSSG